MDGIGWASSAMSAAQTRLEIATQNLANGASDGFQRVRAHGVLDASGVHVERVASHEQGALRHTGRAFDLAIVGSGIFSVRDAHGAVVQTRNGAFTRDRDGYLRDDAGRALLGTHGPLRVPPGASVEPDGGVVANGAPVGRIALPAGSSVHSGFLESSNVNAIGEMIDVMTAQRSFEAAQKTVSAIDQVRQKAANDVARLK